ncbi:hypothetical protein [Streptomyces sp. NPDC126499]|uniref:hypothetical protein n=1 Tax=Streptomyces sp. NPDC126499 TaxID=3155314 RepID=UPI00332F7BD9
MDSSVSHGWQAPSAIERGLFEARQRGDWPVYYDLVAAADLYIAQPRSFADSRPDSVLFQPYWNPQARSMCLPVHTAGMLPSTATPRT